MVAVHCYKTNFDHIRTKIKKWLMMPPELGNARRNIGKSSQDPYKDRNGENT
jgi:hypothetical protein